MTSASPPLSVAVTVRSVVEMMSVWTLESLKPSSSHCSRLTLFASPAYQSW